MNAGARCEIVGKAKESFYDDLKYKLGWHANFSGACHEPRLRIRSTRGSMQAHPMSEVAGLAA